MLKSAQVAYNGNSMTLTTGQYCECPGLNGRPASLGAYSRVLAGVTGAVRRVASAVIRPLSPDRVAR